MKTVSIVLTMALLASACQQADSPPYTQGYTPGGGYGTNSNVGGSANVGAGPIGTTSSSSILMERIKSKDGSNQ